MTDAPAFFFGIAAAIFALGLHIQGRFRASAKGHIGTGLCLLAMLFFFSMLFFGDWWA